MKYLFLLFVLMVFFCKPEAFPKYESYLYKPPMEDSGVHQEKINSYILDLEKKNNINFIKIENSTAYIPPMCYTNTVDHQSRSHNPCYSCHTVGKNPNFINDSDLQTHYDFPDIGRVNPWKNLFSSNHSKSISDSEIVKYIRTDNYLENDGEISLKKNLPETWEGYTPDCYFNFDESGFDKNPRTGEFTGWRAYRYYPFLGTFWATNGSTDDVLIRLPFPFRADKNGKLNLEIYKSNLAILESVVKQKNIITELLDESISGVDLDKNGKLEKTNKLVFDWPSIPMQYFGMAESYQKNKEIFLAGGLFPVGTEFLHSVRYIDWDKEANTAKLSKRMKELRYARKREWYTYAELKDKVSREKKDQRFQVEKRPEGFHGDFEHGFENKSGWVYQGYIEDKDGQLRPQTNEEMLSCMGCHSGLGVLVDSNFSFSRKMEAGILSKENSGWGHWSSNPISNIPDRKVHFQNFGSRDEYAFYLENNGAGDEFRENEEVINKFFYPNGDTRENAFTQLKGDIGFLINPSFERSLQLNKAYRQIVARQTFRFGRDAILQTPKNVFKKVSEGKTTRIQKIIF